MSEPKDGYCWCDMCGFNAKLPAKFRAEVEDLEHGGSYACPWCKEADSVGVLCVGDELDEHVIPDDPMMTWPQTDPRSVDTLSRGLTDAECLREVALIVGKSCDEDVIVAVQRVLASATEQLQRADEENVRLHDVETLHNVFCTAIRKAIGMDYAMPLADIVDNVVGLAKDHRKLYRESHELRATLDATESLIPCMHCNLPLSRHAPALHSGPSRHSCPDGYGWHDHNVFCPLPRPQNE